MTSSGILLDYQGPVNFQVVDSLLKQLKGKKDYTDINTTIRKRTYSLFVECIENILKHSALKESDDINLQPHITLHNEENRIFISARNPVTEESGKRLKKRLDNINNLDGAELRKMHEARISSEQSKGEIGAGLGFICMAFKSGNKLQYSFHPLIPGYLFFEIQISLNK